MADQTVNMNSYRKPDKLSEDEIVSLARLEINSALGYDSNVLADVRAKALDFYHGNTKSGSIPEAPAGRSNIVSLDVHDTVNSLMAEMGPMLNTSMVEFPPINQADEPAAQQESDFIRDQLEKNGWDEVSYSFCHSALLQGLGWAKVEHEDYEVTQRRIIPYRVTDPIEYDAISEPRTDTESVEVRYVNDETVVLRTDTKRRLVVDCVAPENIIFSNDRGQLDTEDLRFIAERKLFEVDTLVEDYGLTMEEAKALPTFQDDYWPAVIARREKYYSENDSDLGGWQDQTRLKEVYCCYMDIAMDRHGPTEKWYLMVSGNKLIESYPVPFHPWVNGSPIPMPHRVQGRGMYDTMRDISEGKTELLRSLLDNAAIANGSRTAYNENTVNVEHLTDGRINGNVAVNGMPMNHIMQMPGTDVTGQMVGGMQYLDEVRSSRGGASVDLNQADRQAMKGSAEAAYNVKVSKEKMAGWYARNLVKSFLKGVYTKAHETMRYYIQGAQESKIRGRWVVTDPAQWPERKYVTVTCGLTEVERRQKLHNLTYLAGGLDSISKSGGGGGILTDVTKQYNVWSDWVRAANVGQPEEYLIDPTSPESIQAQKTKQQENAAMMDQARQLMALSQRLEETRLELDKYRHDTELKFKYWKEGVESAENTQDNATRIQVEAMKQSGGQDES